jgi:dienelactone hydrolase
VISAGNGVGRDEVIDGVDTYITGKNPDKLVLLSADVFGQKFPNTRTLADYIADRGDFTVVVPDQFDGGAFSFEVMSAEGGPQKLFTEWFPKHPASDQKLVQVLKALQKDGKYQQVYATGYCYGSPQVVQLLGRGLLRAGAVSHPTRLVIELADTFKAPILFNCAESDFAFTPELRAAWHKAIKEKGIPATFIDYPGTEHGFTVRTDGSPEKEKQKLLAADNTVDYFKKH